MLIEDIKHPLVSDFLTRITGYGDIYLNTEASSRLNDFVKYIGSITSDGDDFAFYPLRPGQNIGKGNQVFGIGGMASGAPIIFPNIAQWTESGINLGSDLVIGRTRYKTLGIINFSGKVRNDKRFQFRKNETSVFYFLKHNRPVYETSLYRPGQPCPYFWFDDSSDNFGVLAPEFSTSDFRTTGTTYIYDEIYGGDKKGYQVDFSADVPSKYNIFTSYTGRGIGTGSADYIPPPVSFYEIDNNENKFVCINTVFKKDTYSIRSFFGRDYRILTGKFPDPYFSSEEEDPETGEVYIENRFPQRMVIGAGVKNDSVSGYDLEGLDHTCAGILILQGDYSNKAKDIAEIMAETLGIKIRTSEIKDITGFFSNISDSFAFSGAINSINYYDFTSPKIYETYSDYDDIASFYPSITGASYINYGKWEYVLINNITGDLTSPASIDVAETRPEITGLTFTNGVVEMYLSPFGNFWNRGVLGFVSGYRTKLDDFGNYSFTRFTEQTESGFSGFYLTNVSGTATGSKIFPPTRKTFQQNITGYISGYKESINSLFIPFDSTSNLYSSGYFTDTATVKYPKLNIIPQYIIGYISGYFENNIFSGFDKSYIDASSGYFYEDQQFDFLPKKLINEEPVTGFLVGLKSGDYFSGYYQNSPVDGLYSGILIDNDFSNPAEVDPLVEIYFPTGSGLFSGFTGMYNFDDRLGFVFTGFFNQLFNQNGDPILDNSNNPIFEPFNGSSGFVDLGDGPFSNTRIGYMTGIIGSRNFLYSSGEFNGFDSIEFPDTDYGYQYSGFFAYSSGFLGTEIDPITQERNLEGTGIYTGLIGYINTYEYVNLTGFDNEEYFTIGGQFTGFSFPLGSGFSGINGNLSGTGVQTGIIGSKNYLVEFGGEYSGFSGFAEFSPAFLNEINIDFSFPEGSGFSGLYDSQTGLGVMSGVITTGKAPLLFGDPVYFIPAIIAMEYGGNFTEFITGDFVLTGIIPEITGLTYLSGLITTFAINTGSLVTGNIVTGIIPEILQINYYDASQAYIDSFDFNARDYILRLESYEGQQLESGVRTEINKLISGLKADNAWDKITDACLLAGPRTHSGVLIPLKNNGKTGIGYNFISGDYIRSSGLVGDGATKYIDTAHLLSQETTGSQHMAVFITRTGSPSIDQYYIGAGIQNITGSSAIYASGGTLYQKSRASGILAYGNGGITTGFMATSRFNTGIWVAKNDSIAEIAFVYVESGAQPSNIYVFANNNTGAGTGTPIGYSDARIAMYSIGTNVDLLTGFQKRMDDYLTGIRSYIA